MSINKKIFKKGFQSLGSLAAFTLVELIVVISILAILSTIGFVSYSSYLSGVRDTNRISQLEAILGGLELYKLNKALPNPDNNIEIRANSVPVGHQGYVGISILETIDYSKTGKDPKDSNYFSYYLTQDKKYFQLLTFLEEKENLETNLKKQKLKTKNLFSEKIYANTDYKNRYPKVTGKKLGILTQSGTNTPVQEIAGLVSAGYLDIGLTQENYIAIIKDDKFISGTGGVLVSSLPKANCKRIKEMGLSTGSGAYKINPTGTGEVIVNCDMKNI